MTRELKADLLTLRVCKQRGVAFPSFEVLFGDSIEGKPSKRLGVLVNANTEKDGVLFSYLHVFHQKPRVQILY